MHPRFSGGENYEKSIGSSFNNGNDNEPAYCMRKPSSFYR